MTLDFRGVRSQGEISFKLGGAEMIKVIPITTANLTDHQIGSDDILIAPDSTNILYGDAGGSLLDHSTGGNDNLTIHGSGSFYGDAEPVGSLHGRQR